MFYYKKSAEDWLGITQLWNKLYGNKNKNIMKISLCWSFEYHCVIEMLEIIKPLMCLIHSDSFMENVVSD